MGISIVSFPELADKFANTTMVNRHYINLKTLRYVLLISMFAAGAFIALKYQFSFFIKEAHLMLNQ